MPRRIFLCSRVLARRSLELWVAADHVSGYLARLRSKPCIGTDNIERRRMFLVARLPRRSRVVRSSFSTLACAQDLPAMPRDAQASLKPRRGPGAQIFPYMSATRPQPNPSIRFTLEGERSGGSRICCVSASALVLNSGPEGLWLSATCAVCKRRATTSLNEHVDKEIVPTEL